MIRVATYNIHECVGTDGACDPDRVAAVLAELDADLVGLQEVASRPGAHTSSRQLEYLAAATGMWLVTGPTLRRRGGDYGNGLLTRFPAESVRRHDLSVAGVEPRGALDVELTLEGIPARVLVTHLGLGRWERARQAAWLAELLDERDHHLTLVLADLNEWLPLGAALRRLRRTLGRPPASPRTFPSRFPALALDRVWAAPSEALRTVERVASPLARRASDHLPVVASVDPHRASR